MKQNKYSGYIAAGVTAFSVITAGLLLFFALFHFPVIMDFFSLVSHILRPIFYGVVLAFLLLPIHRFFFSVLTSLFPNKGKKVEGMLNLLAIVLSLLLALMMIYILLAMVVPQVYQSIVGLVQAMPGYIRDIQVWLVEFLKDNPEIEASVMPYYDSFAESIQRWLQTDLLPNLESANSTIQWLHSTILPSLTSVATNLSVFVVTVALLLKDLLIAVIVSVYLLLRKDTLAAQSKKIVYSLFPVHYADCIVREARNGYHILSAFINGKLLDSLIIGVICLVCCNLFHFPYPELVSTVVGVTNIIPFFGPFIGGIPCALLILMVNPIQCLYFAIFIFVLQQFDGNILGPKILGDSTGLDAFWVLFSILLFGGLFGFAGMVLGVPVFAMIYSIVQRAVRKALANRGLPTKTSDYLGKTGPLA